MANCARPGCGHEADSHTGEGCYEWMIGLHDPPLVCRCPAFRTQAQQEAWDELRRLLKATKIRDISWETNEALLAAHRVCELYS